MRIEIEQEEDGRWIAEIPELPGVMVYGSTREEAHIRVEALALKAVTDGFVSGHDFRRCPE
jgi:predicted RNase H-like HicB family nuclease